MQQVDLQLATSTGAAFLSALTRALSTVSEMEVAFVGEISGDRWDRIHTLAASRRGEEIPAFTLLLADTPLEQARPGETIYLATATAERQPLETPPLPSLQSFLGLLLRDSAGRAVGAMGLLGARKPRIPAAAAAELARFSGRVVEILERRCAEQELRWIEEATAALGREDYLQIILRNMALALRVRYAVFAEMLPDGERVRILVFWTGTGFEEPVEYALDGTPCADIYNRSICIIPEKVQQRYPRDTLIAELGVEFYMGMPFFDDSGRPIAHIVVMHDSPLPPKLYEGPLFRSFAALAGSEFARRKVEADQLSIARQLMDAQRRESLGLLAGGIAHDFNNLLVGITGNLSLARTEIPASTPGAQYLDAMELAARRAGELAQQMLAYSGRGRFVTEAADLSALVAETRAILQPSLPQGAQVEWVLPEGLPAVWVDVTQIRQVLLNLVVNAAEALEGGEGRIRVETGASLKPELAVYLRVSDTGRGMSAETRARMFEPMFTTKPGGHGLGLSAVQGIVRNHRGQLAVESAAGRGTTVTVTLPATAETPTTLGEETQQPTPRGGRVLVVDDEPGVLDVARAMLQKLDFTVVTAADGQRALEIFASGPRRFDAVLLDLTMPGLSGEQVLWELVRIEPDVRVILMSGYSALEVVDHLQGENLVGVLQKPFRLQDLSEVLRGAMSPPASFEE